ncbi:MAG: hypothetical protein RAP03_01875 [Candidatus Electryonea clarkiae]|nr:hypothetical protein [Candidatus Electryonea clarkiae]
MSEMNLIFKEDVRIGERLYTFFNSGDISEARHIYAYFFGNQNELEVEMEKHDIVFVYADKG